MIDSKLLQVGSVCFAIITSTEFPDVLIPVRGVIEDVKLKDEIQQYKIKLITVYDNIDFINKYFCNRYFYYEFDKAARKIQITNNSLKGVSKLSNKDKVKNIGDLETWFSITGNTFSRTIVQSFFVFEHRNTMLEMYNKIQDYLIIKHLKMLQNLTTRTQYTGLLTLEYPSSFLAAMKRAFSFNFENEKELDEYFSHI